MWKSFIVSNAIAWFQLLDLLIEFVFSSCLKCSGCFLQVLKFLPPHPTLIFLFLSSFCTPTSLAVMLADLKYWVWSFSLVTNPVCLFVCSFCVCFPWYFVFFFCFHPTETYCNFIQVIRRIIIATNDTKSRIPLLVHYTILSYLRRGYLHHGEKKFPQ